MIDSQKSVCLTFPPRGRRIIKVLVHQAAGFPIVRDLDAAVLCDMETTAQCMTRTAGSARTCLPAPYQKRVLFHVWAELHGRAWSERFFGCC
jgi:hypothetical protein